jgi:hypothetical protein
LGQRWRAWALGAEGKELLFWIDIEQNWISWNASLLRAMPLVDPASQEVRTGFVVGSSEEKLGKGQHPEWGSIP